MVTIPRKTAGPGLETALVTAAAHCGAAGNGPARQYIAHAPVSRETAAVSSQKFQFVRGIRVESEPNYFFLDMPTGNRRILPHHPGKIHAPFPGSDRRYPPFMVAQPPPWPR
jgi:hypothetical protein